MSGMGAVGLGAAGSLFGLINANKQAKAEQSALNTLAKQEQDQIDQRDKEIKQESLQPAMIAVRQQQEKINQNISTANSPYATAINYSTLGGLKGKLGG